MPKQVTTGRSGAVMMVNSTGCASFTKGCFSSSSATPTRTLLKNRSETFFSNTTISESLRRMRSNIFTAPPNKPTTLSIVATPRAMPVAPIAVRTRCRRRLVKIIRQRLMPIGSSGGAPPPDTTPACHSRTTERPPKVARKCFFHPIGRFTVTFR